MASPATSSAALSSEVTDLPAWAQSLKNTYVKDNFVHGFVDGEPQLELVLELHGRATLAEYIRSHKDDYEKRHESRMEASRLLWKYGYIPASDCPFLVVSSQELQCQYGLPRQYTKDSKPEKTEGDHAYSRKHRLHLQKGRKVGCPATGIVKELLKYPSHTVVTGKRSEKKQVMADLRQKLKNEEVEGVRVYFVSLPMESMHTHKLIGATRRMSPKIREKIQEFVGAGITSVKVIKKLLRKYVQEELDGDAVKTHPSDRAYYPLQKDISNCVHAAISAGKYSQLDQVQLEGMVREWMSMDGSKTGDEKTMVYFRKSCVESNLAAILSTVDISGNIAVSGKVAASFAGDGAHYCSDDDSSDECDPEDSSSPSGKTFLFVHQEPWQRKLLIKYGNILTLLDSTYKTTKYSLPLFLLCVRSNCGYIPVAEFIVEQESAILIAEALKILSLWNSRWDPPYFMIDYSEAELNAISAVFPLSEVYLCEFHCEQAWTRWIRSGKHNLSEEEQGELLHLLREIAFANTVTQYQANLDSLMASSVYKDHPRVQRYLKTKWLGCTTRWCDAFRTPGFHASVKTNNGVESLNNLFKSCYNSLRTDKTVSGLCQLIKDSFLPDNLQRYIYHNVKFSSEFKLYDPSIPLYLQNRPHWFIKHCMQRLHSAQSSKMYVEEQDNASFLVRSGIAHGEYSVQLGDDHQFLSCKCADFQKHFLPCKHIFAVLTLAPGCSWESLPGYFRNSPLISIDDDVFSVEQKSETDHSVTEMSGVKDNEQLQGMELNEIGSEGDDLVIEAEWSNASTSPPLPSEEPSLPPCASLVGTVLGEESGEEKEMEVKCEESLHVAKALRCNLQLLQDFSYLCKDPTSLKTIADSVEKVVADANLMLPRESGLVLRPTPEKRKLSAGNALSTKLACLRSLPSRKRKKSLSLFDRYKKRVGRYADIVKAASHVHVPVDEEAQGSNKSTRELIHVPFAKQPRTLSNAPKPSKTTQRQHRKGKTKAKPERKPKIAAAEHFTDDEDIHVLGQYMQTAVYPYKKRVMTENDFAIILSSDSKHNWLNDTIINCAQNILRQQFHPPGLYDTSLGPHLMYPRAQFFYQILHDKNHWILVSTVDCPPSSVKAYDSLFGGQLSANIQKQTAAILRTEAAEITFFVQQVQQQPNKNDCGVFAIAFLTELLFNGTPADVLFDVKDMRPHLRVCLLNNKFESPFPKIEGAQKHSLQSDTVITIPVHCVCRMPHFKSDDEEQALQMAECDRCHCWYHRSCVSIPDSVFEKRDQLWFCPKCF